MNFGAEAHFKLSALRHNLQQVRLFAPASKILAMIKSNGYGHGLVEVAQTLSDVDAYGVACLGEAKQLRWAGITNSIVVMRGFGDNEELLELAKLELETVVHCEEQLQLLENIVLSKPLRVWLKIDTGMHRLGFKPELAAECQQRLLATGNVQEPVAVMTHLAAADELSSKLTAQQLQCFQRYCNNLPGEKSIANSAAILNWQESRREWVRPGLLLFGAVLAENKVGADFGLQPVMTLKSRLIAVKNVAKGERVGYSGAWRAPKETRIGIVAVGYGDGYPRYAKNGTPVVVAGRRCELVGRVAMDMINVNLANHPQAQVGAEVILWGEQLPVEIIAAWADTIPYVLLCGITQRVRRVYK